MGNTASRVVPEEWARYGRAGRLVVRCLVCVCRSEGALGRIRTCDTWFRNLGRALLRPAGTQPKWRLTARLLPEPSELSRSFPDGSRGFRGVETRRLNRSPFARGPNELHIAARLIRTR